MRGLVAVTQPSSGRRVYVCGRRLHHGCPGALAVLAGVLAMVHDRRDAREWFHFRRELR